MVLRAWFGIVTGKCMLDGGEQVGGVWGEPRRQGVRGAGKKLKLMGTEMCTVG